jgi:LuxR family transcriptional regulator, regulator of acetate metabolism
VPPATGAPTLVKSLIELQQLQRELIEQRFLRRADGLERIGEAVRRLGEVGSPAGVLARASEELGRSSDFERVLVSRVAADALEPVSLWSSRDGDEAVLAELARSPIPLRYPLVEAETVQVHGASIVSTAESGPRALPRLRELLGWDAYVVAAIQLEGKTVGLLHAERPGTPDDLDLELAALYADGLGQAFERAVLRAKLQRQRRQLESAARWINGQMLRLSSEETARSTPDLGAGDAELAELLTPRELEILRLIARGLSNRAIATTLVIGEGTVKYHVKNLLRKLQARSRTDAVSRYMRGQASRNGS